MRCYLAIVLCMLLIGCAETTPDVDVKWSDELSMPNCARLDEKTNVEMRDAVVRFFVREAGVPVRELTIAHGAVCEGRMLFAVLFSENGVPVHFLVETDRRGEGMKLHRSM